MDITMDMDRIKVLLILWEPRVQCNLICADGALKCNQTYLNNPRIGPSDSSSENGIEISASSLENLALVLFQ